ncbi:uncharacterized protein JCM10292_005371 [Rhodotorula paludigena]|uniref:uncharacterized protein n=1 Tax=Rhodotorula paludigena TaxID=86838 RepID=UPI00317EDD3D
MLLEHDPAALKPWLTRSLEPISDAEPAVLADYVLALLKHDVRDVEELRQFCVQQLDDFLDQLRGFCARGDACHYQHDAFAWTGPAVPAFGRPPPQLSTLPFAQPRHLPQTPLSALEASTLRPERVQHRPPPSRTHSSRPARGASRVISVENIPAPSLTDAAVRHFFAPFGQICDLSLDLERRAATVTFATPAQADRAVSSPQAVFGHVFYVNPGSASGEITLP